MSGRSVDWRVGAVVVRLAMGLLLLRVCWCWGLGSMGGLVGDRVGDGTYLFVGELG